MRKKQMVPKSLIVFLLLGSLVFFGNVRYRQYKSEQVVEKLKQDLEREAEAQSRRSAELRESLEYLHSESFKEKVAREQLNLKKEGELVYNFSQLEPPPQAQSQPLTEESNMKKWLDYFFKKSP